MTTTATVPQVRKYLEDYLSRRSNGAIDYGDLRNVRLLVAIDCLPDIHEGLLAMIEENEKRIKEVRGETL